MKNIYDVKAIWTGKYPCLCSGHWELFINDEDHSNLIPEGLRNSPMDTYGEYSRWFFNEDFFEDWDGYSEGLLEEEWIETNQYWLSKITSDPEIQKQIFKAFQSEDWRHGSCGGCV